MASSLSSSATVTVIFMVGLMMSHLSTPVSAKNRLNPGEFLYTQYSLTYDRYSLTMQRYCNLVFKDREHTIWESGTGGKGIFCILELQSDGNLVIHASITTGPIVWTSDTSQPNSNNMYYLEVTDKAAIYDSQNNPIWINGNKVNP